MHRRKYLVLTGVTVASVAGCTGSSEEMEGGDHNDGGGGSSGSSGDGGGGSGGGQSTPEPTPEPTNEPTMTPAETATPSADAEVSIEDSELHIQEGSYRTEAFVIAEITNTGDASTGELKAEARFYDDQGNLLDSSSETLPFLRPGEAWKPYLKYLDDGEKVASHTLDGEYDEEPPTFEIDGIEVTDTELHMGDRDVKVTGKIANDIEDTIDYLGVETRFWTDDVVINSGLDNITDVPPGEDWAFETGVFGSDDRWEDVNDFDVLPVVSIY